MGYLSKSYVTGQDEKKYGIVHSIGPKSTSQPEMQIYIKRISKHAKLYQGTVTALDSSCIVERVRDGEPTILFG